MPNPKLSSVHSPPWGLGSLWATGPDASTYTVQEDGSLVVTVDYDTNSQLTLAGPYDFTDDAIVIDMPARSDDLILEMDLSDSTLKTIALGLGDGAAEMLGGGYGVRPSTFSNSLPADRFLSLSHDSALGFNGLLTVSGSPDGLTWTVLGTQAVAVIDVTGLSVVLVTRSKVPGLSYTFFAFNPLIPTPTPPRGIRLGDGTHWQTPPLDPDVPLITL